MTWHTSELDKVIQPLPLEGELWKADANCQGLDTELFFPENTGLQDKDTRSMLQRTCAACTVRTDCLNYAIDNVLDGFWAGTTPRQRIQMRKNRQKISS